MRLIPDRGQDDEDAAPRGLFVGGASIAVGLAF